LLLQATALQHRALFFTGRLRALKIFIVATAHNLGELFLARDRIGKFRIFRLADVVINRDKPNSALRTFITEALATVFSNSW